MNLLLYVSSNPVSYFDAVGLRSMCCRKSWSDCWGDCIEARRWDWWEVIPFSALPKRMLPPFRVPRPDQPLTTVPSSVAHLLGGGSSRAGAALRSAGRFVSRFATPVVVFEGFYDGTTVLYCAGQCASDPCRRFFPVSDLFTVTTDDLVSLFR